MRSTRFVTLREGAARSAALFFGQAIIVRASLAVCAVMVILTINAAHAASLDDIDDRAKTGDIVFAMDRKGKEIGHHSVTFSPLEDGRLQVDVAIHIKVKFAFITAYRYEHHNREIWSADGKTLLSIETRTNNNGKDSEIEGALEDGVFVATDETGKTYDITQSVMPTSYWNAGLLSDDVAILNTQKGTVTDTQFRKSDQKDFDLPDGDAISAHVFESEGELKNIFAAYANDDQCWVGLTFYPPKQDTPISYRLTRYFEADINPALSDVDAIKKCISIGQSDEAGIARTQIDGAGGEAS